MDELTKESCEGAAIYGSSTAVVCRTSCEGAAIYGSGGRAFLRCFFVSNGVLFLVLRTRS